MTRINRNLAEVLKTVQRPGDFYVSGTHEIFAPNIAVTDVGVIALPLLPQQAAQLVAVAERAPYGRGTQTLVDTEVRRTWQIGADRIRIGGRHWAASLEAIVSRCAGGLGIQGPVTAELYKMLVYDEGSFFVGHRDTEKVPGMFATLVIVLPSVFAGGELLVRHQGREVCLDLATQDASEVAFAAFYADCWHEVRPIARGCRVALIYNLIRPGRGPLPQPPAYDAEVEKVIALLNGWRLMSADGREDAPRKLIYPLEHVYTPAEIGFAALKNADAAVAALLMNAARQSRFDLHLALVSIEESGSAEMSGYRSRRYYDEDDGDYEVGEVFDRSLTLTDWRSPDGGQPPLTRLPFSEDELCPPDVFDDAEPDDVQFFEATGNAGASFERSYRRAALVLWPHERRPDLIAAAGRDVSLPYLADLAARWRQGGDEELGKADLWREGHDLACRIVAQWPALPAWGSTRDHARWFLEGARALEDREAIMAFIEAVSVAGDYGSADNAALVEALALFAAADAAASVRRIVVANAARQPAACAELLRMMSERPAMDQPGSAGDALRSSATALFAALPGHPVPTAAGGPDRARATPELVADLLLALCRLQAGELGTRLVGHVVEQSASFPMDKILVLAALSLAGETAERRAWSPIRELTAACRMHLTRRIAEPLEAPADFSRPSQVTCRCQHCVQLAVFLADPKRKQWIFKAAEALRRHVEDSIRRDACDVDTETLRHTRPYELLCIKNQASYQRQVEQRQRDIQDHERLLER